MIVARGLGRGDAQVVVTGMLGGLGRRRRTSETSAAPGWWPGFDGRHESKRRRRDEDPLPGEFIEQDAPELAQDLAPQLPPRSLLDIAQGPQPTPEALSALLEVGVLSVEVAPSLAMLDEEAILAASLLLLGPATVAAPRLPPPIGLDPLADEEALIASAALLLIGQTKH